MGTLGSKDMYADEPVNGCEFVVVDRETGQQQRAMKVEKGGKVWIHLSQFEVPTGDYWVTVDIGGEIAPGKAWKHISADEFQVKYQRVKGAKTRPGRPVRFYC
jgi:hypothetical protein